MIRCFLCLLLLLGLAECRAQEYYNWGGGPIEMPEEHPLYRQHLSLPAITPEILRTNQLKFRTSLAWSNTANFKNGAYLIDAEERATYLQFGYGLGSNLELGFGIPVLWRGAGVLDSGIRNWHNFWNLPQGDRPNIENDQFDVSGANSDGSDFGFDSRGFGLGNLTLSAKYLLSSGDQSWPALAALFKTSLPTARDSFGHAGLDIGAMLLASKKMGPIFVYAGAGYKYLSDPDTVGLTFRKNQIEGFLQAEYQFWNKYSFNLGLNASSKRLKNVRDFPSSSLYIDTGFKYALSDSSNLELLVRENPYPRETTTDFTFLLGYDSRWNL